jgi:hypothetical protein
MVIDLIIVLLFDRQAPPARLSTHPDWSTCRAQLPEANESLRTHGYDGRAEAHCVWASTKIPPPLFKTTGGGKY